MFDDRYGHDILGNDPHRRAKPQARQIHLTVGTVLEDVETGFVGAVVRTEKSAGIYLVELEDRRGTRRSFPLGAGFWLDGEPIIAQPILPARKQTSGLYSAGGRKLTNSGSIAPAKRRATVAKSSRIWVEGRHDAELVQHVWGEDLAVEGIVVELLDGADHLLSVLSEFSPTPDARAGVLLDHMVPRSKESRIATEAVKVYGGSILVLGHPYVDIWQAVKPSRLGLKQWPAIPRGIDIKVGTLEALGWANQTAADIGIGWQRILKQVRDYRDLEAPLLGRVEELIDFVTSAQSD